MTVVDRFAPVLPKRWLGQPCQTQSEQHSSNGRIPVLQVVAWRKVLCSLSFFVSRQLKVDGTTSRVIVRGDSEPLEDALLADSWLSLKCFSSSFLADSFCDGLSSTLYLGSKVVAVKNKGSWSKLTGSVNLWNLRLSSVSKLVCYELVSITLFIVLLSFQCLLQCHLARIRLHFKLLLYFFLM